TPVGRASIAHAMFRDEGYGRVQQALAHPGQIGTQGDLFGKLDARGRIKDGPLKGHSVNEIQEQRSRFIDSITPQQDEWLRRMEEVEESTLDLMKRNGVEIDEIPLGEVERYAGRVVVGKVTPEGELIEARFVG